MPTTIVIPTRMSSTRFPGKPLALIRGATGKPKTLIARTIEVGLEAAGEDGRVIVATEDQAIVDEAALYNVEVIETRPVHNGTERVALAAKSLDLKNGPPIINLQGDALLTDPQTIRDLVEEYQRPSSPGVVTPVIRCDGNAMRQLDTQGIGGAVYAAVNSRGSAMYFSRALLHSDHPWLYQHLGLYAYSRGVLSRYMEYGRPSPLEKLEKLEQLRFLDYEISDIQVKVVKPRGLTWEINHPSDIGVVERELSRLGIE